MNLYETTFIINPQTDDATIDRHVRSVADLITTNGGAIKFEDHMGTRRLAYEIQGLNQGYYASFIFDAPTSLMRKLDRHFKLNESYIRYLTVRFEGDLEKLLQRMDYDASGSEGRTESSGEQKSSRPETQRQVAESSSKDEQEAQSDAAGLSDEPQQQDEKEL
ncbi:MAG: 30S ribosomal protein S6 [Candidatus Zixiibacteriota bacterium]